MLDAIGAGLAPRIGNRDWADVWRDSPEYQKMRQEIEQIKQEGLALPVQEKRKETTCKAFTLIKDSVLIAFTDATSFWVQVKEVTKRNNWALWRSPDYVFSRLFVHVFISLFISLSFLQLGDSSRELQYRVFGMSVLYFTSSLPTNTHTPL